ncbi:MAG TPA: NFACT RNA binding domain-containing protein [Bacteriovoracaceae bacterium]|nr:NFACT RNA binding domain-containing protein [Bacteriovoracaceae bacterium]
MKAYLQKYNGPGQLQKIFSTPHLVAIAIRYPGKSVYLYLGRGNHYEGLWWSNRRPDSLMRIQDKFLMYLRKFLENSFLQEIVLDDKDRAIGISYQYRGNQNFFALFYSGRKAYFLNSFIKEEESTHRVFCSWLKEEICGDFNQQQLFDFFDAVGRKEISHEKKVDAAADTFLENYLNEYQKNFLVVKHDSKKKKFLEKKIKKIREDLHLLQQWPEMMREMNSGHLDLSNNQEVVLCGVKIKLQGENNLYRKRDIIFNKIKSFKAAEAALSLREQETVRELTALLNNSPNVQLDQKVKTINPEWYDGKEQKKSKNLGQKGSAKFNIEEYFLEDRIKILVGKDSTSNDYLRSKIANKEDYWFHLAGYHSAHAIVKISKNGHLRPDDFAIIGSIIRYHSKLELMTIPLIFTQVKNIKGVRGSPGSVLPKKAKNISVFYQENWQRVAFKNS